MKRKTLFGAEIQLKFAQEDKELRSVKAALVTQPVLRSAHLELVGRLEGLAPRSPLLG